MRVVMFDIDCLRPDHLGCYGYNRPTSPTIDALAQEGIRFNHYYCASSPCLPSRTVWSSGRFGIRNGVISNHSDGAEFHIRNRNYGGPMPENDMWMRRLRSGGWDTISFSNFADRHNAWWFMVGWSEFHTVNLKGGQETGDEVNEKVLDWLRKNEGRDDYLLHINYWDTHRTYKMSPDWANPLQSTERPSWPDEAAIQSHQDYTGPFTAQRQFKQNQSTVPLMPGAVRNRQEFEQMIDGYDASIRYADAHVKEVLDELERQGVLDKTAIIITSDHGDAFGEHGIYSDHVCADECIHRIPLIIRWPGIAAVNTSDDSFLYNVDLPATVCELVGLKAPEDWDGASFAENIKGRQGLDHDYLVWDTGLYTVQRAVRTKQYLMIKTYDAFRYEHFQPVELYDIVNDPYQTKDLSADRPDIVQQCSALLDEWIAKQRAKGHNHTDPVDRILEQRAKAKA